MIAVGWLQSKMSYTSIFAILFALAAMQLRKMVETNAIRAIANVQHDQKKSRLHALLFPVHILNQVPVLSEATYADAQRCARICLH